MSEAPAITKRSEPHQRRSQKTHDQILIAAAELLAEVGFEKLSTNKICRRAGLTPPALYRYFPNKYAVLTALGEDLMRRQNDLLDAWSFDLADPTCFEREIAGFLKATIEVTQAAQSGAWIMRTLHATPLLAEVRLRSHQAVAQTLTQRIIEHNSKLEVGRVYQHMRLGVELGYAVVEMVFDEANLDAKLSVDLAAALLAENMRLCLLDC